MKLIFKPISVIDGWGVFFLNYLLLNVTEPYGWQVSIDSDNGLVPPSTKPITWSNIDPVLYCHVTPLHVRHTEFMKEFTQGKNNEIFKPLLRWIYFIKI